MTKNLERYSPQYLLKLAYDYWELDNNCFNNCFPRNRPVNYHFIINLCQWYHVYSHDFMVLVQDRKKYKKIWSITNTFFLFRNLFGFKFYFKIYALKHDFSSHFANPWRAHRASTWKPSTQKWIPSSKHFSVCPNHHFHFCPLGVT